ncbi:hypothetical protein IC620_00005 [Hazenella sp. IB182357]|uniref:Uncharacterized protein n=1 Tax=Polycladospora coralii TaxID=2771432 RepID=A0A926RT15_9BACL|nr:hypothetical protein [Polycladospora coralii]MBD1370742.1 hypothetical protein [Polycladospora coralii]MBS7529680.1 hypothetical protein [Polycladospora coralii]
MSSSLGVSVVITVIAVALFGVSIGLKTPVPWASIIKCIAFPYMAAFPILCIQLWLSMILKNQAFLITIGIAGAFIGGSLSNTKFAIADWLPWIYPYRAFDLRITQSFIETWAFTGIWVGLILLIIGALHFSSKEVVE